MDSHRFELLVTQAVSSLPEEFRERLENIDIVVADYPTRQQLKTVRHKGRSTLLGLYEGVPLTNRTHGYGFVMPDKITIFQLPIESICKSDDEVVSEVRRVVVHEIGHHFGIDDDRLEELGI